ncbi:hypothetical protein N9140_00515 [bacterium]|nr:hypothetical protein [bacterium]
MLSASFCEELILDMVERVRLAGELLLLAGEFLLVCVDGNGDWNLSADDGVSPDDCFFPRPVDFGSDGDDDGGVGDALFRPERKFLAGELLLSCSDGVDDALLFDDGLFPCSGDFDPFVLSLLGDLSLLLTMVLILQI